MLEREYQAKLIKRIKKRFPGCVVIKNDAGYIQGIPDLLVLFRDRWAMLEVKESAQADEQPNQDHYISLFDQMSFAAFIFPENEKEILNELQHAFRIGRATRIP